MRRSAPVFAAALVVAALIVASPSGAAEHTPAPETAPPASALADEPFLVQYGDDWRRYAAGNEETWAVRDTIPGESVDAAYERLLAAPGIEEVAFNYRYEAHGTPNDPLFTAQWHLHQINASLAWEYGDGTGVTVAVLDSGVATGGEDLNCREFVDPYNGITDEWGPVALIDDNGHGTHVTGTIAQCTNNGIGTAGVAPGVSIMPVKVMDHEASATTMTLYRGMVWAIEHDADIINLSLGIDCHNPWPDCSDPVIDFLLESATEAGIVIVASSGNDGGSLVSTPANHPSTIAVGATTIADIPAPYSAHGPALDVVAPGGSQYAGIWQETMDGSGVWGYYSWSGTSMAAPHVTGTVALMRSVNPAASPEYIREILASTAVDLDQPGWDEESGFGRIDAAAAVEKVRYVPGDPCPSDVACDGIYGVDSTAVWSVRPTLSNGPESGFYYGVPGDIAFSGDWDCDGDQTPGLYRQSDGFVYLRNSATQGIADLEFYFGDPGDIPIAGDFNGDGCDTVSVYRGTEGRVYVINRLGEDGGGLGAAELDYYFGDPGDKPFAGDFNGDGIDTVGLHRETTGLVYYRNSHSAGAADSSFVFGDPGDQILAGDWNHDTIDTVAVYRPATETLYVKLANSQGVADHEYVIGSYAHVVRAGDSLSG